MPAPNSSEAAGEAVAAQGTEASVSTQGGESQAEAQPQQEAGTTAAPAASSPAEKTDVKPKTPLEVVKAVMLEAQAPAKPDATKPAAATDPASKSATEGSQETGQSTDELAKMSPKARDNFKKLELDRDKYREQSEQFGQKAQRYDTLSGFLGESNITADDFSSGLKIMRAMKNDPAAAYDLLRPVMDALEMSLGHRLPPDLQQKVENGVIDEGTGRELARQRGATAAATSHATEANRRAQALSEERQQAVERQETENYAAVCAHAVSSYESDWMAKDPDYQRKRPFVRDKLVAIITEEGLPESPEGAIEQVKKARAEVEGHFATIMPVKTKPVKPLTGGSGGQPKPRPSNPLDVVKNALATP